MKLLLAVFFITIGIVKSAEIQCKFEYKAWGGYLGEQYACNVINSFTLAKGEKITKVYGTHLSGKCNSDVKGFWIENKNLQFIPKDIQRFFPNIIALTFYNTNLLEINEEDFKPFPNLISIFMNQNQIKVLKKSLFQNNPRIGEIKLDDNKIQSIENVFDTLEHLVYLYLTRNICVDVYGQLRPNVLKAIAQANEKCKIFADDVCLAEKQALKCQVDKLLIDVKNAEEAKSNLARNITGLNERIRTLETTNADLNKKVNDYETKIKTLTQQIGSLENEKKNFLVTIAGLNNQTQSLASTVERLTKEIKNYEDAKAKLELTITELNQKVKNLESEKATLLKNLEDQKKITKCCNDSKAVLETEKNVLVEKNAALTLQVQNLQKENEKYATYAAFFGNVDQCCFKC